jgi:hypothetical protein
LELNRQVNSRSISLAQRLEKTERLVAERSIAAAGVCDAVRLAQAVDQLITRTKSVVGIDLSRE